MLQFLRSNKHFVWLVLFILTLIPHIKISKSQNQYPKKNEKYNASHSKLNTLDKLVAYSDVGFAGPSGEHFMDTALYVLQLTSTLKERFYHGELNYSCSENWIAFVAGKVLWSHLSSIVIIDDILKHPQGLCSQQTMVFMAALKKKNISVRSVGLGYHEGPGHFLCEVRYGGEWHLFDVSNEPNWEKIQPQHKSLDYYLLQKALLYKVYEGNMTKPIFDKIMERHTYGKQNVSPAMNMRFFQKTAWLLGYLLPLMFGILSLVSFLKKKRKFKSIWSAEDKALSGELFNEKTLKKKINY